MDFLSAFRSITEIKTDTERESIKVDYLESGEVNVRNAQNVMWSARVSNEDVILRSIIPKHSLIVYQRIVIQIQNHFYHI